MSNALRQPMTVEEFLAWEERQELRYEFDGFRPVAMTGAPRRRKPLSLGEEPNCTSENWYWM